MRHLNKILAGLFMTLSAGVLANDSISPADRLISVLADIDGLQASFQQNSAGAAIDSQVGQLWLQKPNKFRVETTPPLSQTIVSDGDSLWTYDRDLEQLVITSLDVTATDIPVLLFAGDPIETLKSYRVEFFEHDSEQVFLLNPLASDSMIKGIVLKFRDNAPSVFTIENTMRERTVIELSGVSALAETELDLFSLVVPDSVDVIDDRPGD
jgi:outer membrane lipoprotein carrier protein